MGNRVSLDATKFVRNSGETYGFCAYDDYDQAYYNCAESNIMEMDDLDLLRYAIDRSDERLGEMISFVQDEEKGMYINDTWYDYEELKSVFEKVHG